MALPIAQLGYMPNINAPSHVSTYQVENPWEKLAMQVLANAAGSAVGNVMQRDYATQATAENPEQVSAGPFISPETGQSVGGGSTTLGPQNAGFFSKLLQGPTMGADMYGQQKTQQHQAGQQQRAQEFTGKENAADRTLRSSEATAGRQQQGEQFNQSIGLDRDRLKMQQRGQDTETLFKGRGLAIEQQRADDYGRMAGQTRRDNSADDAVLKLAGMMREQAIQQATQQAVASGQNPLAAMTQVPPLEQFMQPAVAMYQKYLASLGVQQPAPNIPGAPLISP